MAQQQQPLLRHRPPLPRLNTEAAPRHTIPSDQPSGKSRTGCSTVLWFVAVGIIFAYTACAFELPQYTTSFREAAQIASLHGVVFVAVGLATLAFSPFLSTRTAPFPFTPLLGAAPLAFVTLANALIVPALGLETWFDDETSVLLVVQMLAVAEAAAAAVTLLILLVRHCRGDTGRQAWETATAAAASTQSGAFGVQRPGMHPYAGDGHLDDLNDTHDSIAFDQIPAYLVAADTEETAALLGWLDGSAAGLGAAGAAVVPVPGGAGIPAAAALPAAIGSPSQMTSMLDATAMTMDQSGGLGWGSQQGGYADPAGAGAGPAAFGSAASVGSPAPSHYGGGEAGAPQQTHIAVPHRPLLEVRRRARRQVLADWQLRLVHGMLWANLDVPLAGHNGGAIALRDTQHKPVTLSVFLTCLGRPFARSCRFLFCSVCGICNNATLS